MKKVMKTVAVLIAALAAVLVCGSCKKKAAATADGVRKIQVIYWPTQRPYQWQNEKNEPEGYFIEIAREIDKRLPQYEFEYIPDREANWVGLETGKYQFMLYTTWRTKERQNKFLFADTPWSANIDVLAYRKADEGKFTDLESFAAYSGKLVPISPQNGQWEWFQVFNKHHPDTPLKLVAHPSQSIPDAYPWVAEGRYDGYITGETSFANDITDENGPFHALADSITSLYVDALPGFPVFNKKEVQLKDDVEAVLKDLLAEGFVRDVAIKYFGRDTMEFITHNDIFEVFEQ